MRNFVFQESIEERPRRAQRAHLPRWRLSASCGKALGGTQNTEDGYINMMIEGASPESSWQGRPELLLMTGSILETVLPIDFNVFHKQLLGLRQMFPSWWQNICWLYLNVTHF